MLQGVSYVQASGVYIRNLRPNDTIIPSHPLAGVPGLSGWGYATNFAFTEFSEVRMQDAV
jgi:hypothetical protein